jgi:hypothetical protein
MDMSKTLASSALCLGLLALSTPLVIAQGSPEVIVRQGDTIEWVAATPGPPAIPHKVRFGGNGATSFAVVKDLLDFDPALTPDGGGIADSAQKNNGTLLKAKVKDTADVVGKTFVFVCGIHTGQMLSLPFKIEARVGGEAPRTHKITGEVGLHWHLHVDTSP